MLNIYQLEKKWLSYKLKSLIPLIIITIISILIFILINNTLFKGTNTKTNTIKEETKVSTKQTKQADTIKEETKVSTKQTDNIIKVNIDDTKKKIILTPSLSFINHIKEIPKVTTKQKIIITKHVDVKEKVIKEKVIEKEVISLETVPVKKNKIIIVRQNSNDNINKVIKRFKNNNNPALSLFIAKKYYETGNYNQAYNYSLITNQLKNDIEDSWIIFSKSLVKLNKKNKSIEVLQKYIKHSNSNKAQILLDNILLGKFK